MSEDLKLALLERLDQCLTYTLTGGNDPEDPGSERQAIEDLGNILKIVIDSL